MMIRSTASLALLPLLGFFSLGANSCTDNPPNRPGTCTVDGRVYADGDTGVPSPDGCNTCTCEDGAITSCTERGCAEPRACIVDGVMYAHGTASVPAPDGCNTCVCDDGAVGGCTEIACNPDPDACVVDGTSYPSGSSGVPAPDGCNTCSCIDGAVTACTEIACPPPGPSCTVYGEQYDGSVPSNDGCNTCSCVNGEVTEACTKIGCPPQAIEPCSAFNAFESDPFELNTVRVTGDTLEVDVQYGGGCKSHYFRLCYGAFLESNPVQVELRLEHDNQDDACRAYLSDTREFDLAPLADEYRAGYQTSSGTVILRLGEGATYTF